MMSTKPPRIHRKLLNVFIYGSLLVLLTCLFGTAVFFSVTYLNKEQARAEISREQLLHFFEFQYSKISEEMWTQNYEAINFRVDDISRQLGKASHELVLANEKGQCVFSTLSKASCEIPERFAASIDKFGAKPSRPLLSFESSSSRHQYIVPLFVGAIHKGYLYAEISDPYEFYRGSSLGLALKIFVLPIICVLFIWVVWLLISRRMILRPYLSSLVEMEKNEALGKLAAQVAHDIRSPLVAMKSVIATLSDLEEDQRRIITAAGGRIESIANDLITQFTGTSEISSEETSFLHSIVDSIVAEKRAMIGETLAIEIVSDIQCDFRSGHVAISTNEISRVLSNLVNNSIDALRGKTNGTISVTVSNRSGRALLSVKDDGIGIEPEVLHKLRTQGGSYGKSGGTGMGIQHAKEILARINGSIVIESIPGKGTEVILTLPVSPISKWCADQIDLSNAETVLILEDDISVHHLWKHRLSEFNTVFITDPEQFDVQRFPPKTTRYIFDYEIRESPITGLDLIASYKLGARAVLVTSHFSNKQIQQSVELAGSKMLPKFMISAIEILGNEKLTEVKSDCDLVLIDDESLMHDLWSFSAQQSGKKLKAVTSFADLDLNSIGKHVPIYVDKNLNGECGFEVAARLHECGFTNIRMATGENLDRRSVPFFIREVRNKDFPLMA